MLTAAFASLLMLQVGPAPATSPVSPVPEELHEQRRLNEQRRAAARPAALDQADDPVRACFARAESDPEAARYESRERFDRATGLDRAIAGHCLGYALMQLERWQDAAEIFARAKDAVPDSQSAYRDRLGAATGAARLAAGEAAAALAELAALGEIADRRLAAIVALDRARALVSLGREAEAATALEAARTADPDNPEAWLLSATLARRMDRLEEAQAHVERAAMLRPTGPEIGLEAGVIAVLSGRDEAAVRSWQSVIETAPGTPAAAIAAGYLAQLRGE